VGGKPLIVRSIEAAKKSKKINRIIVSTDDNEISTKAKDSGAEVIERGIELSNDEATSESVLLDVLNKLKKDEDYVPDITVFLQCTSPFTISDDIDGTIDLLHQNKADSAFVATEFHHFLWQNNNGTMIGINHNEKIFRKRRQDMAPQFLEAGSVYAFLTSGFLSNKNRFFGKIMAHEIPADRVFEIDIPLELEIADKIDLLIK